MGRFCVAALERPDLAGSSIDVGGPEALDGRDLSTLFSKHLGRSIGYQSVAPVEFENMLSPVLGPRISEEVTAINRWWREHLDYEAGFVADTDQIQKLLPIGQMTSMATWISRQEW